MKAQLKKLKGSIIKNNQYELQLVEAFRECTYHTIIEYSEVDQIYYLTNLQHSIIKIIDLDSEAAKHRFIQEKNNYQARCISLLARYNFSGEFEIKKKKYGYIVLSDINTDKQLSSWITHHNMLQILIGNFILALKQLYSQNLVFLNIKPQNIYLSSSNDQFIILEPIYLTNSSNRSSIDSKFQYLFDEIDNQYKYWSPQLLDMIDDPLIDYKSDMYVMGCILYELMVGTYPFENRLAMVNNKMGQNKLDDNLGRIVRVMMDNYGRRPQVDELSRMIDPHHKRASIKQQFDDDNDDQEMEGIKISNNVSSSSLFDDIRNIFNKYTKETQGWYLNYVENNSSEPLEKYLQLMLRKLYNKNNKAEKLCSIIKQNINTNGASSPYSMIKTLLFIGNLVRKGPVSVLLMYTEWKDIFQTIANLNNQSPMAIELIKTYKSKLQLHRQVGNLLAGNFHLQDISKFKQLSLEKIQLMNHYLKQTVEALHRIVVMKKQQLTKCVINLFCDEIYDLLSMLIISVISLRKDNQLQLRNDQINKILPLEKTLNQTLRKVSTISNYISAHAIYSIEVDYSFYQQEIQLRENPYYTSLEHFYRSSQTYKGLTLPINYIDVYLPNKAFQSGDSNTNPSKGKSYFQESNQPSPTIIKQDYKNNEESPFKVLFNVEVPRNNNINISNVKDTKVDVKIKQSANSVHSSNLDFFQNKPPTKLKTEAKDGFSFEEFSNIIQEKDNKKQLKNNVQFNMFDMFAFDKSTDAKQPKVIKSNIEAKDSKDNSRVTKSGVQLKKNSPNMKKSNIAIFNNPPLASKKQTTNMFEDFNKIIQNNNNTKETIKQKKQKKQTKQTKQIKQDKNPQIKYQKKPTLDKKQKKISTNINDLFNIDWLKDSQPLQFSNSTKNIPDSQLKQIQEGLKLNQLKDLLSKHSNIIVKFEQLQLNKVIGSGSAGQVYLGTYHNQVIAIKKVKTQQNPNALKQFQRQLVTYIKIQKNPYLVSLVGLSKSKEEYYLLTQFCNSGSLFDLLHKKANTITLSWKQRTSLALHIAKGMYALHSMKPIIIHRDLKSLNVFVNQQNSAWIAKVADFGLSRSPQADMMTSALGTLHWMAPQLLENKQYSFKVDVYSYGILLWEICSRKTPYHTLTTPMAIMRYVTMQKKRPGLEWLSPDCPSKLIILMQKCWAHQPSARPTFKQVIQQLESVI